MKKIGVKKRRSFEESHIMKTTEASIKFIIDTLHEQRKESETARLAYVASEDPRILADFINASPFVLKTDWVLDTVVRKMLEGDCKFLREVFSTLLDKRKNKMRSNAIKGLRTAIEVHRLVAGGLTKNEAFKKIADLNFEFEQDASFDRVKNEYYRHRNKKPLQYVEEYNEYYLLSESPAIIERYGVKEPGMWKTIFDKKGEKKGNGFVIYTRTKKIKGRDYYF